MFKLVSNYNEATGKIKVVLLLNRLFEIEQGK